MQLNITFYKLCIEPQNVQFLSYGPEKLNIYPLQYAVNFTCTMNISQKHRNNLCLVKYYLTDTKHKYLYHYLFVWHHIWWSSCLSTQNLIFLRYDVLSAALFKLEKLREAKVLAKSWSWRVMKYARTPHSFWSCNLPSQTWRCSSM